MERRAYEQRHQQPQPPATASPLTVKEAAPPVMIKKIGKTTYRVKIHFSETSKETMSDKIKRLILNDSEKSS